MRILVATGLYPPDIGGPATYSKMLEEHLPECGIELTVAPYGWVRRYPRIVRHLVYTWKLIHEVRTCDALYALDPISVGLPVLLAHMATGKPYVLRVAGDYAWEQGQLRFGVKDTLDDFVGNIHAQPLFVRLLAYLERKVAKRAKVIVVPSKYMEGIVSAWNIPKEKIAVIYSALHPLSVKNTREEIRKMFNYRGLVIATAGRLVPWKGMDALIALMPELSLEIGDVSLVIIGDGPLMGELKMRAQALGVGDAVRFVGSMPKDTLGAAIKGADIFVLNTQYEGLSHQLLEVMDLGVPIVTTNVGGNLELIQDGVTGLLVKYNDRESLKKAIGRIAKKGSSLGEELVQRARLRTKDFEKEKVVGELAKLLKERISIRHERS